MTDHDDPASEESDFLEVIESFLRLGREEVLGHGDDLPEELRARFAQLARGELSRDEIVELSATLKENPEWVASLAAAIQRRGSDESSR